MSAEHTVYSQAWLHDRTKFFFRDAARSVAFGLLMSFSFLIIIMGISFLSDSEPAYEGIEAETEFNVALFLLWIFIGIPVCVACWWGAIEVADDNRWEANPPPSIWDNQEARMLESTLYLARQLEERGNEIDMSIIMSDDIHSKAHELIDQLDTSALRLYMVALMGSLSDRKAISQDGHTQRTAYLCKPDEEAENSE